MSFKEVQDAIWTVLENDSIIKTTYGVTEIYDTPPDDAIKPYISISEVVSIPQLIKNEDWFNRLFTISVWTEGDSTVLANNILDRIHTLLNKTSLTLAGGGCPAVYTETITVVKDPDNITFHGIIQARVSD